MVVKPRWRVTRFVLLFEGRTGSSYCMKSLAAMGRVRATGEELVRLKPEGWSAQERWIEASLTPPLIGKYDAVGFKTKLRDVVDHTRFAELLDAASPKVIYMKRRSRIRSVVSMMRSRILKERTGSYNAYTPANRLGPTELDLEQFDELLQMRERLDEELDRFVANLSCTTRTFYYEDLVSDDEGFFRSVCGYLGTEYRTQRSSAVKNTSNDLRQDVLNYDELCARYAATPYAREFDDPEKLGTAP